MYANKYGLDYDGTHVDPEWHGWLHYTRDEPPTVKKPINYKWVDSLPEENQTGSIKQYIPYSTTRQKIEPWTPKASNKSK